MQDQISAIELQARVYVKKPGDEYMEITGIRSFERGEDGDDTITFTMDAGQETALRLRFADTNEVLDVKMELSIGMLMSFSANLESITATSIGFWLVTPVNTDICEFPPAAMLQ